MINSSRTETELAVSVATGPTIGGRRRDRVTALLGHGVQLAAIAPELIRASFSRRPGMFAAGDCTTLADGLRTSPEAAAFENGTLMHARAQDDTLVPVRTHVTACALPAVLAICEAESRSIGTAVDALAVAYEVAWAIGAGLGDIVGSTGARATAVFGPVAAAAAAARALGLDTAATGHAMAIASSAAGGTSQMWSGSGQEWATTPGFAAATGVRAALLASSGMSGADDWLTGRRGLLAVFAGGKTPLVGGVDSAIDLIASKPFPICETHQNTAQILAELSSLPEPLVVDDIALVELMLNPNDAGNLGVIDNPGPFPSWTEAMLSAQYCAAVAITRGRDGFESLTVDTSGPIESLLKRIEVVPSADVLSSSCRVRIHVRQGQVHELVGNDPFDWSVLEFRAHLERTAPADLGRIDSFLDVLGAPEIPVRELMSSAIDLR